jgi:hypothetical protein
MPSKRAPSEKPEKIQEEVLVQQKSLEKRLLAYGVASAGVMFGALRADAQIVYTPSNIPMAQGFAGGALTQLDLNNDGKPDFAFSNYSYSTHGLGAQALSVKPAQTGNETLGVQVKGQRRVTAAALDAGVEVGSQGNFQSYPQGLEMAIRAHGTSGFASGSWLNLETAYLGLEFLIDGEVHYGWARIKFTGPRAYLDGSIYGYAYESTPNKSIVTGQTGGSAEPRTGRQSDPAPQERKKTSLGSLAAGSLALGLVRN